MGTHIIRTVVAVFPYLYFLAKFFFLPNTERHPAVLLKRSNGCKLEQFEASQHRGRSERKVLVIRTIDASTAERPDEISRCPDGCNGFDFSDLESVQNLLETFL